MAVPKSFEIPADRHYDSVHHLWARRDAATGRVVIGLDRFALEALGDLAYISLPEPGTTVDRGESVGTLEAAKTTQNLVAPIGGTVVERNEVVLKDPLLINRDPYDAGWLVSIEPADWETQARQLISGGAIAAWVESETERYRSHGSVE